MGVVYVHLNAPPQTAVTVTAFAWRFLALLTFSAFKIVAMGVEIFS